MKAVTKPQYVDVLPNAVKGDIRTVEGLLQKARSPEMDNYEEALDVLGRWSTQTAVSVVDLR